MKWCLCCFLQIIATLMLMMVQTANLCLRRKASNGKQNNMAILFTGPSGTTVPSHPLPSALGISRAAGVTQDGHITVAVFRCSSTTTIRLFRHPQFVSLEVPKDPDSVLMFLQYVQNVVELFFSINVVTSHKCTIPLVRGTDNHTPCIITHPRPCIY